MLIQILTFIAGLILLAGGAKYLVEGSSSTAISFGIRPLIVGMTVVAFGTSMPEFVFNLAATIAGNDDLGLGNIVGSNIANIALVLGVSALFKPIKIDKTIVKKEYPIVVGITLIFTLLALDRNISEIDGMILTLLFILFFVYLFKDNTNGHRIIEPEINVDVSNLEEIKNTNFRLKEIAIAAAGLIALIAGAKLMVDSSVFIAKSFNVPELVIGLTIVAVGTSLPELAASVTSSIKNESDISLGNILGSNIFNILFVIGILSIFAPTPADGIYTLSFHFPFMLAITLALWPILYFRKSITRLDGLVLLIVYIIYSYLSYYLT